MTKRFKWTAALWSLYAGCALASPPVSGIPPARHLVETARRANEYCRPLLLEFAVERCEYCKRLEEEFLSPMRRNRDYDRRVVIRRVPLDTPENIFGFDGRPVEATVLAARYAVRITPTLVFVNARGEEIAESMVGFNTPELYGAYLHHALDTARAHLVEQEHCVEDQERPVFK